MNPIRPSEAPSSRADEVEFVGIRQYLVRRDQAVVQRAELATDLGIRFDALADRVERIERSLDLKD